MFAASCFRCIWILQEVTLAGGATIHPGLVLDIMGRAGRAFLGPCIQSLEEGESQFHASTTPVDGRPSRVFHVEGGELRAYGRGVGAVCMVGGFERCAPGRARRMYGDDAGKWTRHTMPRRPRRRATGLSGRRS